MYLRKRLIVNADSKDNKKKFVVEYFLFVLSHFFIFRNNCFHSFIENTQKLQSLSHPLAIPYSIGKWKMLTQKFTTTWIFKDFCCSSGIPTNINFFVMFILATWRKSKEWSKKKTTKENSYMKCFLQVVALLYKQNCSTLHVKGLSVPVFPINVCFVCSMFSMFRIRIHKTWNRSFCTYKIY